MVGINLTGSKYEEYVDRVMDYVAEKADAFEKYVESDTGKENMIVLKRISSLAIASLFALSSPKMVLLSSVAGFAIRVFSPEQMTAVEQNISKIWKSTPFEVQTLAAVLAFLYIPRVFPISAGLGLGFHVGGMVSPEQVVHVLDKAEDLVAPDKK